MANNPDCIGSKNQILGDVFTLFGMTRSFFIKEKFIYTVHYNYTQCGSKGYIRYPMRVVN